MNPLSQQQAFDVLLPDDMVVLIGTFVAECCGLRDFVSLSRASKRTKKLLMDSKETVAAVVRLRMDAIHGTGTVPTPNVLRTLEQLKVYETMVEHQRLVERWFENSFSSENSVFDGSRDTYRAEPRDG